jgi:hypothetical protein
VSSDIRAALERLLGAVDVYEATGMDVLDDAIAAARAALAAEPVGEGPSERIISIAKAVQECAFSWEPDARLIGNVCAEDVADLCAALRAAADHVVPEAPDSGDAWFLYNKGAEDRQQLVRFRLLAIAAELEGPNA